MEPINISQVGGNRSNYRLRGEPVKLFCKQLVGSRPSGDGWEEVWDESEAFEKHKTRIKPGVPRKQAAARKAVPLATVRIVQKLEVADKEVVFARLEGKSEDEVKIAELESEIRKLMGLL